MRKTSDAPICERGNDLVAFLYGEIDEPAAQDFDQHLLNCAQCELELGSFKQIRSSVSAWRQETVGSCLQSMAGARAVTPAAKASAPSAIAAIRKFFELSPVWMKASLAFAALLLCMVSAIALLHLFEAPKSAVVENEKRYTQSELKAKIEDAVKARLSEFPVQDSSSSSVPASLQPTGTKNGTRSSLRAKTLTKNRRGPLTKIERQELAADLRLILTQEELELLEDRTGSPNR